VTQKILCSSEEKKDDEVEEVEPQAQEMMQDFHDTTFLPFHAEIEKLKWMSSLVSS
jgi:hypothetical protein